MDSTIQQINRQLKGTDLHSVQWRLIQCCTLSPTGWSQTNITDKFWSRRTDPLIETACFQPGPIEHPKPRDLHPLTMKTSCPELSENDCKSIATAVRLTP